MGVDCIVSVSASHSPILVQRCLDELESLEQLWSRFLPHSDISRLNQSMGTPIWVDPRTVQLIQHMVSAHSATQGAFNPTLLPLQLQAGDTHSLTDSSITHVLPNTQLSDDLSGIRSYEDGRVSIPASMTLDAGGIAKGFAADLVSAQALHWGATDVCINMGGDMAVSTSTDSGWNVDILSPVDRSVIETVSVRKGGVASSSISARNRNGQQLESHIFSGSDHCEVSAIGASVIANTATWAEAWTKFAILTPTSQAIQEFDALGLAALIVDAQGTIFRSSAWKEFVL